MPPNRYPRITKGPFILVTPGGGGDGAGVIDWVISAYEADPTIALPALIVFGPFMSRERRKDFAERIARLPKLESLGFEPRLELLMNRAHCVVAMGGYNTFCEILSFDKPALIVPRVKPRLEQAIRAERADELKLIDVLHDPVQNGEGTRDPLVMAAALHRAAQAPAAVAGLRAEPARRAAGDQPGAGRRSLPAGPQPDAETRRRRGRRQLRPRRIRCGHSAAAGALPIGARSRRRVDGQAGPKFAIYQRERRGRGAPAPVGGFAMAMLHLRNFALLEPDHGELRGGYELLVEGETIRELSDKPIKADERRRHRLRRPHADAGPDRQPCPCLPLRGLYPRAREHAADADDGARRAA